MTIERPLTKKFCEQCLISGIKSPIQLFQLNDDEALLMCKNEDCTYMPSSNWADLIVKRHISQINRSSSRKTRPWSLPSSSASSNRACSVQSAPHRLQVPVQAHSKSSTPCLVVKPHSTSSLKEPSKVNPQQKEDRADSPTPSLDSSASDEVEQKTFVPIAPFLCRHAHSFASFETKGQESDRYQEDLLGSRDTLPVWNLNRSQSRGLKRRGSSLDSDSLSSCSSSLDSRPESPIENSAKTLCQQTFLNPTKKIVLSAEAVSKLQRGTCKLKLIKDAEGRTTEVKLVPLPPQSNSAQISSTSKKNLELNVLEKHLDANKALDFENDSCLKSNPHGHSADRSSTSAISIQAHIDAINKHLAALSEAVALNGSDLPFPLELSRLIPQVPVSSEDSSKDLPQSVEGNLSTASINTDSNCTGASKDSSGFILPQEDSYDYSELDEFFIDNFTA